MINATLLKMKMVERGFRHNKDLAKAANLSQDTVNDLLEGRGTPSFRTTVAIFKALELDYEEGGLIFFGNELCLK